MAESDSEVDRKGKLSQSVDRHDEEKDETKHNGFKSDVHSHIFRCEHCDDFETNSNSLKALHIVNCSSINRKLDSEQECQNEATPSTSNSKKLLNPRKLFECDVCNMKFSNGANMRRHKMRHTGVKPYECRVCQKRFFRKDHLAEHFTTHTKTLPYHCPICNRGFQRQIAMRAHFQNEHVGQHDLVKTCPMCSYRAGTMKSLRAHFFNRHGIDLDNPGTGSSSTSSSLLLALSSQNNSQFNNFAPNKMSGVNYSDSGDSVRSMDNSTPPMNLLTPQVEIVTNETNDTEKSEVNDLQNSSSEIRAARDQFQYSPPSSPYVDTNANIHPISHCTSKSAVDEDSIIKPSISIIPLENDHYEESTDNKYEVQKDLNIMDMKNSENKVSSMIKISPLKSLLREDLKRRIYSKANNKFSKNATNGNNNKSSSSIETNEENKCLTTFNPVFQSAQNETDMPTIHRRKILPCFFCGIEFPDQTLYFLHKGCHSESNPWKCNICGEQCNNVYEFNSHLLSKSHQ